MENTLARTHARRTTVFDNQVRVHRYFAALTQRVAVAVARHDDAQVTAILSFKRDALRHYAAHGDLPGQLL